MGTSRPVQRGRAGAVSAVLLAGLLAGCSSSSAGTGSPSPAQPGTSAPSSASTASGSTSPTSPTSRPVGRDSSGPAPSSGAGDATAAGPAGGSVPSSFEPSSASFVSAEAGWVLGTAPCARKPCTSIVRTRDGGRTWRGIPAPKATLGGPGGALDGAVSVLRFADPSNGWAGVNALYSTHDGGATWHQQHVGPSGSAVTAIATSAGFVFVTVGCPAGGGSSGGSCSTALDVYGAPVGSDHWTKLAGGIAAVVGDSSLRAQDGAWYVPTRKAIYRGTHDGGVVSLPNPCPSAGGSRETATLAVADRSHLDALCLGDGAMGSATYQLYGTSDGARTWRKPGAPTRGPSDANAITDNGHGVLLVSAASGASTIMRTTDDGIHFSTPLTTTTGGGREWADLGFTTTTQAVVVLPDAALYLSRDSGASFAEVHF